MWRGREKLMDAWHRRLCTDFPDGCWRCSAEGKTSVPMSFLIDWHNLIARIPDITLSDPDDEANWSCV
jgi:hypothetical protein